MNRRRVTTPASNSIGEELADECEDLFRLLQAEGEVRVAPADALAAGFDGVDPRLVLQRADDGALGELGIRRELVHGTDDTRNHAASAAPEKSFHAAIRFSRSSACQTMRWFPFDQGNCSPCEIPCCSCHQRGVLGAESSSASTLLNMSQGTSENSASVQGPLLTKMQHLASS